MSNGVKLETGKEKQGNSFKQSSRKYIPKPLLISAHNPGTRAYKPTYLHNAI